MSMVAWECKMVGWERIRQCRVQELGVQSHLSRLQGRHQPHHYVGAFQTHQWEQICQRALQRR
eukprot:6434928-Karenia_brevis.AAC.1